MIRCKMCNTKRLCRSWPKYSEYGIGEWILCRVQLGRFGIVCREFARVLQVIGEVVWGFSKSFARIRGLARGC